jgi:uroporphyrinogen-III synthase
MKLLITRPLNAAKDLNTQLQTAGHKVVMSPLLEISYRQKQALDLNRVQAFAVTSVNGIRGLAQAIDTRDMPVFAVGEKSASFARQSGFSVVYSADGDVAALAALMIAKLDPAKGDILHGGGARLAGDLGQALQRAGFSYRREVLYDAHDAEGLSARADEALKDGSLDGVLLFSPHTAKVFKTIIDASGYTSHIKSLDGWCLSQNVATEIADLGFAQIHIASKSTEKELLTLIAQKAVGTQDKQETSRKRLRERTVSETPKDDKLGKNTASAKSTTPQAGKAPKAEIKGATTAAKSAARPAATASSSAEGTAPKAAAPVSRKSNAGRYAAAFVAVFLLGIAAWPILLPKVAPYLPEQTQALLKGYWGAPADDTELANRMAVLENQAPVDDLAKAVSALSAKLAAADQKIAALEAAANDLSEDLSPALALISEKLTAVEATQNSLKQELAAAQQSSVSAPQNAGGIEPKPVAAGPSPETLAALADLKETVASAKLEIVRLKQSQTVTADDIKSQNMQVGALSDALKAQMQQKETADANGDETLILLALGQLHRESRSGEPFTGALQQAIVVAPENMQGSLANLSDAAVGGAPTLRALTEEFNPLAIQITQTARLPNSETWYGKTLHNLANLVKFRRVGDISGGDVDATVARAEDLLLKGDLASSVLEIEKLEGPALEAASGWLVGAKKRVLTDQSLDKLLDVVTAAAVNDISSTK